MQIRETDRVPDTVQLCSGVELAHRFTLDPALGRGEKAHLSFSQSVHISFLSAVAIAKADRARQSGIGFE